MVVMVMVWDGEGDHDYDRGEDGDHDEENPNLFHACRLVASWQLCSVRVFQVLYGGRVQTRPLTLPNARVDHSVLPPHSYTSGT